MKYLLLINLIMASLSSFAMEDTVSMIGQTYYSLGDFNKAFWFRRLGDAQRTCKYAMVPSDFTKNTLSQLNKLGLILPTHNGEGNLFIRPDATDYQGYTLPLYSRNSDIAAAMRKAADLMKDARLEFSQTLAFLTNKKIPLWEMQKYIYALSADKAKVRGLTNTSNYAAVNKQLITMRIENLIAFAKNFVFAEEKLSKVFPGLIEAFLAHEYIYGIYASQREIFLQPTRASGKNISVTPLSAHEMDVLFGSLAQALDLLRPFAEQALSLIYEEPIVLKVCDYEFRESKDAPLETTDLPDVTALVEELASNTTSISKVRGSNNKAKRKRRNQAKKRAAVVMNMRNQEQNLPDAVVVTTILTSTTNSTTTVANENEILAILNNIGDREEKAYDSAETIPSDDAREVTELAPIVQTKIDSPLDSTLETRKEVVARRRKSSIPQFMLEPNSNRDSQQASISKKVVNRTSDEKLITCLERKNVISILGELSSRNMRLLKEIFDHSSVNLKYSAQEIYVLAESIAAIIDKKYDSTIALQFLKQLSNHLHPSHKASDYGDKLKNDYVDKLRPFFIMAGIYPADWAPQTANDVEAKQKYFLRLLEAKKRNQFS